LQSTSLNETACMHAKLTERGLAKIVGRHYLLFKVLYPDLKFNLLELATKIRKDPGNLSKLIKNLEKNEVVETEEVGRDRGRPFKYIKLSSKVAQIISSFIDAAKPVAEPKYSPSTIDICLDVIEDDTLDEEVRMPFAESLDRIFTNMPVKLLNDHERLRETLEDVVRDPPANGQIEERKRSMIKMAIPRLIMNESTNEWTLNHVYPNALKILQDENRSEDIVSWAISMLEDIALRCPDQEKAIKMKLREMYFNETIKQDNRVAERLKDSILEIYCREAASARELANYLRERAKSQKKTEKEKAILLLRKIVNYLPRYDSIT